MLLSKINLKWLFLLCGGVGSRDIQYFRSGWCFLTLVGILNVISGMILDVPQKLSCFPQVYSVRSHFCLFLRAGGIHSKARFILNGWITWNVLPYFASEISFSLKFFLGDPRSDSDHPMPKLNPY